MPGQREVRRGLGGHCRCRRNKGSRWILTEMGWFGSLTWEAVEHMGCQPGYASCLLLNVGHDLLVTSSGPVPPDPG